MRRRIMFLVLLVALSACSSPTIPTAPTSSAAPTAPPTSLPLATKAPGRPTAAAPAGPTQAPITSWSSTSPDGQWQATGSAEFPTKKGEGTYHAQLKVARADGKTAWTAVDESLPYTAGYTTPQPLRWSRDGQGLYFTNLPHFDGCAVFANGQTLQRLDLKTGRVTQIMPNVGSVLSLSPDERIAAYIPDGQTPVLVLRFMATAAEEKVNLPAEDADTQAGSIAWSENGTALVLTIAVHPCDAAHWMHSIVRVDVGPLSLKTLVSNSPQYLRTVGWRGPATLDVEEGQGNFILMDALTGGSPTK
jgi:hypothetical protein